MLFVSFVEVSFACDWFARCRCAVQGCVAHPQSRATIAVPISQHPEAPWAGFISCFRDETQCISARSLAASLCPSS